jgi:two-component system, OmpR family, response regulator
MSAVLRVADVVLDEYRHEVFRGDKRVPLTATEFALLRYLMVNEGRVVSKREILEDVWPYGFDGSANLVETYVSYLRRKLGPPLIKTVRKAGYVFVPSDQ